MKNIVRRLCQKSLGEILVDDGYVDYEKLVECQEKVKAANLEKEKCVAELENCQEELKRCREELAQCREELAQCQANFEKCVSISQRQQLEIDSLKRQKAKEANPKRPSSQKRRRSVKKQ